MVIEVAVAGDGEVEARLPLIDIGTAKRMWEWCIQFSVHMLTCLHSTLALRLYSCKYCSLGQERLVYTCSVSSHFHPVIPAHNVHVAWVKNMWYVHVVGAHISHMITFPL